MMRPARDFLRQATALVAIAAVLGAPTTARAGTIYWNMQTATATSNNVPNVTPGALVQGNNNGTTAMLGSSSASSGYNFTLNGVSTSASGTNNAGAAARIGSLVTGANGSAYFEFILTPDAGYSLTLSDIGFGSRSTSTGPVTYTLRSSLDAYASDLITAGSLTNNSTWAYRTSPLTTASTSTAAVTYRLYGYAGSGTASANTANWRIDDLMLTVNSALSGGGGPVAKDLTWNVAGSGSWDSTTSNWTTGTGSTTFTNADTVGFGNTAGGTITVDAGGVQPGSTTISAASGTYTFTGGAIGGTGAVTKSGAGVAVLSAANTYSGGTTINSGVLEAASNAALGATTGGITFGGGTLRAAGTIDGNRTVTVNAGGGTIDTNGNSVTVGGIGGTGSITKAGAGTLTSTGFSAGGLNVSAGTLRINAAATTQLQAGTLDGVLELGGAQRFNLGSGTLGGTGTIRLLDSLAGLHTTGSGVNAVISSNVELNPGNASDFVSLIHASSGNTIAVNRPISGNAAVQFSVGSNGGAGITTLNAQSTYSGGTFLNMAASGVLRMGTNDALPAGSVLTLGASHDGLGTQDRGTVDLAGYNLTVGGLASVAHASTRGIGNTSANLATLTVNQASDTTFHAQIGSGFATTTNMEAATTNIALVKTGGGRLTLTSTASNFTGGTTVSAGTLSVSADANLGGSAGGITLGGGRLELTSGFTLGAGRTITAATGTSSTIAVTSGTVSYAGPFTGSGNLDKAGVGTLSLGNASSGYSGTFTISAGTLEVTAANAFANATLTQTGGTLLLAPAGGGDVVIPEMGGSGGEVSVDSGASAVFRGNSNRAYDGRIRGQGAFKKEGNGILTLNADNDFTGNTRVSTGRLKLGAGGALSATPQIAIDSGAIFDVADRSGFALGTGQRLGGRGTVLGDLQFGGGSQLAFDPTGPLLVGSGTVSFASGFGIGSIFGLDANVAEGTYTLLNETTGGSISFASLANVGPGNPFDLGGGKSAYFQQGSLQVVVVPEPDAFFIGGLGLALAGLVANRRRSRGTAA
jgi:fibronectin-binding autotransporter adhesin